MPPMRITSTNCTSAGLDPRVPVFSGEPHAVIQAMNGATARSKLKIASGDDESLGGSGHESEKMSQ